MKFPHKKIKRFLIFVTMKKTIIKKLDKAILEVEIETNKNYFSITGILWEKLQRGERYFDYKEFNGQKYEFSTGGCIHDLILQHFPQLQSIVSLHLSDLEGKPMYYIENGTSHLRNDLSKGLDYWRVKEENRIGIQNTEQALTLLPILLEQWKKEANEAIKLIESL